MRAVKPHVNNVALLFKKINEGLLIFLPLLNVDLQDMFYALVSPAHRKHSVIVNE